ncbi:hypothetical protein FK535_09365 [Mycolicibacterium sp. 018/SC-01/001]|nr:hypothetical protein FK535_09365 [Mycolicibacterium sp. 018/SC-01/001]
MLDDDEPRSPRHRAVSPRSAVHVGRVGALAVSLGIGFAVAHAATGVAAASDGDGASSESPASVSSADGPARETARGNRREAPGLGTRRAARERDADAGANAGPRRWHLTPDRPRRDDDTAVESSDDDTTAVDTAIDTVVDTDVDAPVTATPRKRIVERTPLSQRASHDVADRAEVALQAPDALTDTAPLSDSTTPASNPVNDGLAAYVRRLITHTLFNKSPVVRSVTTEQLVTGQVIVRIDAYDPNDDPLTYEIEQPSGGLVVRNPLDGTFLYTPTTPVIGNPRPVEFTVVVSDSSVDLPGLLGLLHTVARVIGLAQADTYRQTVAFTVDPLVQLPPVLVATPALPYVVKSDPVKLLSAAAISDPDSSRLQSVTVTIVDGQSGDLLSYVAPQGSTITPAFGNGNTSLTLSGLASLADYEAALKAITFSATKIGLASRTIAITLTDEQGVENLLPAGVVLLLLPALQIPPSLLAVGGGPFRLGADPVKLFSVAEISDLDSSSLSSVTVSLGDGKLTGDTLSYTAPQGSQITASFGDDNRSVTLTGPGTLADYEAALEAITFSATQFGLGLRAVNITLTDDDGVGNLVPVAAVIGLLPAISVELPLTVTPVGAPIHTIGKPPVKLISSVLIANADGGNLTGATVVIGAGRLSGDKLTYTAPAGSTIDVSRPNDWTIELSGLATVEQYTAALEAISFSATQVGLTRSVTITVTEQDGDTSPVPGIVFANTIAPLRPLVTVLSLPPTYTLGKAGVKVAPNVEIGDLDSTVLNGATVTITGGREVGDLLSFAPIDGNPVSASWNGTDTLTLSGTATLAQYEAALEAVTFTATTGAGLLETRTVTIDLVDDSGVGPLVPATVLVGVKTPDRPTIVTVGATIVKVNNTVKPITLATIADTDSTTLTGASVAVTAGFRSGDTLGYTAINGNPVTAVYNSSTGVLTLSGTATIAQYKQALEAVTFKATQLGTLPTRTITVNVTDDSNLSAAVAGLVLTTVSLI